MTVRGRDLGSVVNEGRRLLDNEIKLPKGYSFQWSGDYESEVRAMNKLAIVVPISLIIIFVILLILFRKVKDVMLVLINIPFAIVGGILALMFTQH